MNTEFNYYSFMLNNRERIYYSSVYHETAEEILDWAARYNFITEKDISNCNNVKRLLPDEVQLRNQTLYEAWWEKLQSDTCKSGKAPPTIGEVQLD